MSPHRGGNDGGRFVDLGRVTLDFRRPSIVDLKGGAQPIRNETGRIAVTVNGEIYNFQALRRGLERRGHSFSTDSDAEVVVVYLCGGTRRRLPALVARDVRDSALGQRFRPSLPGSRAGSAGESRFIMRRWRAACFMGASRAPSLRAEP